MVEPPSRRPECQRAYPRLVGREREQAILRQALDDTLAGTGSLFLVGGEAGIGKTSLALDLARSAAEAGALTLTGHAYDLSVTPPYGPWLEIFDEYPLSETLPPLPAFTHGFEASSDLVSGARLFAAAREFFVSIAAQQPLVLVLDDLQWADQASLDLLRVMSRRLATHRILIVATFRPDEPGRDHPLYQLLPLLISESGALRLDVRPLDQAGQRALLLNRYDLADMDQVRLERYLTQHAEGNPLYLGELLRSLEEESLLVPGKSRWQLGKLERLRVPAVLRQVIERRLAHLDPDVRSQLQVAAIIGQEVPLNLWQNVAEIGEDVLADAIEQGQAAYLIEEEPGGTNCRFRHALLRDALYQEMSAVRRRRWHRSVAEHLSGMPFPDVNAVAHHFSQAGDNRAVEWLLQAGDRAQRTHAWISAADRFEAAASLNTDSQERGWLLVRAGWLRRMENARRSIECADEAVNLADLVTDESLRAYGTYSRGLFRCYAEDIRRGINDLETGIDLLDRLESPERRRLRTQLFEWGLDAGDPRGVLTVWYCSVGRYAEARRLALHVTEAEPPPRSSFNIGGSSLADAYSTLAIAHAALGEVDESLRAFARSDQFVREAGDDFQRGLTAAGVLFTVILPYFTDRLDERQRLIRTVTEALEHAGGVREQDPRVEYALHLLVEGNWHEVREMMTSEDGSGWLLAPLARDQGDPRTAWKMIKDLLPSGPDTELGAIGFFAGTTYLRLAAALSLDENDNNTARAWLEAHDRWLTTSGAVLGRADGDLLWACYYHAVGNSLEAREYAERALAQAGNPRQPLALLASHRTLGGLDIAQERYAGAETHLQQALTIAKACAAPFETALTLLGLAELRLAQRRSDAATTLLNDVQTICEPLGAKPALERVSGLRQLVAQLPTKTSVYPAGLSQREVEVLRLVAEGLTDADVAERLFVSRRTITSHLTSIYNKIGIGSRAAAAVWAKEHDLI